jgi:hypothetical protein
VTRTVERMSRPWTLTGAVVLQWLAAVIALLAGFDLLMSALELPNDSTKRALEQAMTSQGVSDVSAAQVVFGVAIAGVMVLAIALLRIVLAVYLARGRSWARLTITVLVLLNVLAGVVYLFQDEFWRGLPTILLELVVLWLLYNARSSAYITERSNGH